MSFRVVCLFQLSLCIYQIVGWMLTWSLILQSALHVSVLPGSLNGVSAAYQTTSHGEKISLVSDCCRHQFVKRFCKLLDRKNGKINLNNFGEQKSLSESA